MTSRRIAVGPARNEGWRGAAGCRDLDPDLFFTEDPDAEVVALRVCASCPVRDACFDAAMATREAFGVWGGTTGLERRRLLRAARRSRPHAA